MAVDNNFERLEEKLNNLIEILTQLRREKDELEKGIAALQRENEDLKDAGVHQREEHTRLQEENTRLQEVEREHGEVLQNKDEVKGRIENILAKLDEVEL